MSGFFSKIFRRSVDKTKKKACFPHIILNGKNCTITVVPKHHFMSLLTFTTQEMSSICITFLTKSKSASLEKNASLGLLQKRGVQFSIKQLNQIFSGVCNCFHVLSDR